MQRFLKRLSAIFLTVVVTVTSVFVPFSFAADDSTIESSKSTYVTIARGDRYYFLKDQTGKSIGGSAWQYTTNKDSVKGAAYCVAHGLTSVAEGVQLPIKARYETSPKTMGAFAAGYPQVPLSEFITANNVSGLTDVEYRYATQLAVWASLGQLAVEGTAFTAGAERIVNPASSGDAQQIRVFKALQAILSSANAWTKNQWRGMYLRYQEDKAGGYLDMFHEFGLAGLATESDFVELENIGGIDYYTIEYYTASATPTKPNGNFIDVVPTGPEGTIIVNADTNQPLATKQTESGQTAYRVPTTGPIPTTLNANGVEYLGKFKIAIPAENAALSGQIKLTSSANITQYEMYIASNPNKAQQSYIIADPATAYKSTNAIISWTNEETENAKGNLQVLKTNGTGSPLLGATFELRDSGSFSVSKTTGDSGTVNFNDLDSNAAYTLYETKAPDGYAPVGPRSVQIEANVTSYLTIRNDNEPKLRVKKIDKQNSRVLSGATFEFRQIDGSFVTTATTEFDGFIEFGAKELPFGSYAIKELNAPDGYLPDTTLQTVHWNGSADVTLSFANVRIPGIILNKVGEYGEPLSDAIFNVYKDGQLIDTLTTGDNGSARALCGLGEGYYEFEEIAPPTGYVLDPEKHGIYFDPYNPAVEDDPVITVVNKAKPNLLIIKYDAQTMARIPDTTFEVYRDTELIGSFVTDENGEILINVDPGTYLVKEVGPNEGYVANSTPQQIEIPAGAGVKTLVFLNYIKPGIHLSKLDSATLMPLLNARFLIEKVGDTFKKEYVTDENGEIDLSGLDPGAYIVKELAAPDGYLIDDDARTIQINGGENALFVFTDTRKPVLEVLKYDGENYLPGATFRIAKIEDGSHYLDRITDINGKIRIEDLDVGIYSVKELQAPPGYVPNETEYHVELFPGKTSQLVVVNEKKPNLLIRKTDAITGEPLGGVQFTVSKTDSSTLTTVTTDGNGESLLVALDPGVYTITEKSVPFGYLLDETPQQITLVPNETGIAQFKNYPKPSLVINKVDSLTKSPVKGAKFQVIYASNNTFTGEINDLGFHYTDEDGQITLEKLRDGWYRIIEVEPAHGYSIKEPASQDIYINAGVGKSVTFENIPLSALVIRKIDSDTGLPVQGAAFRVRYLGGTSGSGGTIIFEGVTSHNGAIVLTGLNAGTYIAEEYRAAPGYELSSPSEKTAYISGNQQDVVELEFTNAKKGEVLIRKLDSATNLPLSGARFMVTDSSGALIGPNNGIYTTDATGLINLTEYLSVGSTIVVREEKAPDGYTLDDTAQTLKIKENTTHMLTFYNTPSGGLQVLKLDSDTKKPISGVELALSKMNGERIGVFTTDNYGEVFVPGLDAGWYTVTEIKEAKGYILDSSPHNIEVKDGITATLTITNGKASGFLIHKIDAVSEKGIYGVKFLISDENNNPIRTVESDQNGYVYVSGLADGKYFIREIEAAKGYIPDTQSKTFYVSYGATTQITWKNTPVTGQIQITKRSFDDNPINGFPANTLLSDATFEVYDRAGNKVDTIRTDKNGWAATKTLPLGRYTIREAQAPAYYFASAESIDTEIEFSGQIVRLEVYNKSAYANVSVTKRGYAEVVPGQMIRYDFKNIANNSTMALDSFYWRDTLPTNAVRLDKIITGTWSHKLSYKIVYKTNIRSTERTLADNLSTGKVYTIDASAAALGLASNEYITEFMFVFGRAPAGFKQIEAPYIYCKVLFGLTHEYRFTNKTDVGGLWGSQWIMATDRWVTVTYSKNTSKLLPRTGY